VLGVNKILAVRDVGVAVKERIVGMSLCALWLYLYGM